MPDSIRPSTPRRWGITGVCFVMAFFAWGSVFYGNSFFISVLSERLGWSTALLASGVSTFYLVGVLATLVFGWMIDRWGVHWIAFYGAAAMGTSLALLSVLKEPWQMYAIFTLLGTAYPALATLAISSALLPWFKDKLGLALGISLSGASVGGAVIVPTMTFMLPDHGFDTVIRTLGLTIFICLAPFVFWMLKPPPRPTKTPTQGNSEAQRGYGFFLRSTIFWRIFLGCAFALGAQVGYLTHQIPAISQKVGLENAAFAVSITALSAIIGRFILGYAAERWPLAWTAGLCYGLQGIGILMVPLVSSLAGLYFASAVAGVVVGAIVMLPPLLLREAFGTAGYGRSYGLVNIGMYSAVAVMTWVSGLLRDIQGDYTQALFLLAFTNALAAIVIILPVGKIPARS